MKINCTRCVIFSMLCTFAATHAASIKDFSLKEFISQLISPSQHHKTLRHEYTLENQEKIRLANQTGSVVVKTNWNQKKLLLTATISSKTPDALDNICIAEKRTGSLLELKTCQQTPSADITVDYELIVPEHVALDISTKEGNISVKQVTKPTQLATTNGSIAVYKAQNAVVAHVFNKGSIEIEHAHSTVKAGTKYGNITVRDAHTSVVAHAEHGAIAVHNCKVPSTAKIELMTDSGTITAQLPSEVNAELQAHTKKGMVTCEHMLTLKPFTTTITKNTFDRLKHDVEGTLGSGEAQIFLSSLKGNIVIEETVA